MSLCPYRSTSFEGTVIEVVEMDCDASAVVGNNVRVSETINNFAEVATNNQINRPVIGRILEKITSTECVVQLHGVFDLALERGRLYLDTDGTYRINPPAFGFRQVLGYCYGNGKAHLNPNSIVTKIV